MFNITQAKKHLKCWSSQVQREKKQRFGIHKRCDKKSQNPKNYFGDLFPQVKRKKHRRQGILFNKYNVAPTSPGKGMLSCFVQEILFPILSAMFLNLDLHIRAELKHFLKSTWMILMKCLKSYLITVHKPSKRSLKYASSQHVSSSPFKSGFNEIFKSLAERNSHSSIPASLVPNHQLGSNTALI